MANTIGILKRLLVLHCRSLPMYVAIAKPWTSQQDANLAETLDLMAQQQGETVDRIATTIQNEGGVADRGDFPMEFTDLHDLSLDYLARQVVSYQKRDISEISQLVEMLDNSTPAAKAVAEEALGQANGHLESLEEALSKTAV